MTENIENMKSADEKPRMRPIEIMPIKQDEETMVLLRDPAHFMEEPILLSPLAGLIVTLFTGEHSIANIGEIIEQQFKQKLPLEDIAGLAVELDKQHLLENENFIKFRDQSILDFKNAKVRPAFLAGKSYPDDMMELQNLMASFYLAESGPGLPKLDEKSSRKRVRGMIAPHIDLVKGGPAFAHSYHALAESDPADLYVILGTGHAGPQNFFTATSKDFDTPFGVVNTDGDFLQRLNDRLNFDLEEDEILHKTEHVIEFQLLFLQHMQNNAYPFKIAPILCSYSPLMMNPKAILEQDSSQEETVRFYEQQIKNFSQALRETIAEHDGKVCVISSVDMAHMGPRYGDEKGLTPKQLEQLEIDDRLTLELVAAGSGTAFSKHLEADQNNNRRRIFGYPCIHTMLTSGDFKNGELLQYDQTQVDEDGSVVSFGSMVFR